MSVPGTRQHDGATARPGTTGGAVLLVGMLAAAALLVCATGALAQSPGILWRGAGGDGRLEVAGSASGYRRVAGRTPTRRQLAALFASGAAPAGLDVGAMAMTEPIAALELQPGEEYLNSAVIDPGAGFAYVGTDTSPGRVVKIRLSDFTRVGALTLNAGEDNLESAVIDPGAGLAYFGTDTSPGRVVKVRLSDFTRVGAITLNPGEDSLYSAVLDPGAGFVYFGTFTSPGIVVKVRLSDFTRVTALPLHTGENILFSAVIDPGGGFAYFGTITSPGRVIKVSLSPFTRVGALTLAAAENGVPAAVIDTGAGFAYLGTNGNPGKVVKVRLSDLVRVGAITLNPGENTLQSAVIATGAGFAYFGTWTAPGIVVRVRLSDFTRAGALTLNPEENSLFSAVIDAGMGFAYFATETSPGRVVRVVLGSSRTTLAATANPSVFGQPVTFTAAVAPLGVTDTPTGTVSFAAGGSPIAGCSGVALAAGTAHCITGTLAVGAHAITAAYPGDAAFDPSTGALAPGQVVNKAATTTAITSDAPDPSAIGQAFTVSFTVAAKAPGSGNPGGNVTVSDGVGFCTAAVAAGSCALALTTAGTRILTATYAGNASFAGSASIGIAHVVAAGGPHLRRHLRRRP